VLTWPSLTLKGTNPRKEYTTCLTSVADPGSTGYHGVYPTIKS